MNPLESRKQLLIAENELNRSQLVANLIAVAPGRRFTLNPVVILVSLIFWTWLWGVPGALLSVPILVSIKAVCERIPAMSSVSELLGR